MADNTADTPIAQDDAPSSRGRPSSYDPSFALKAERLTKLGATDAEIAEFFGVSVRTVYAWKVDHDDFSQALKRGKKLSDDAVEKSLFRRATGYSHDAVKILQFEGQPVVVPYVEHYPPDTTAAIFWLKNRRPKEWRDKQEVEHSGQVSYLMEVPPEAPTSKDWEGSR